MKRILICCFLLASAVMLFAGETDKPSSFDLSFSNRSINYLSFTDEWNRISNSYEKMPSLLLSYDYRITDWFSLGAYAGMGLYEEWEYKFILNGFDARYNKTQKSIQVGVSPEVHFLPVFNVDNLNWIDFYAKAGVGYLSLMSTEEENIAPAAGNYIDYSLIGGCRLYFSEHWGLKIEGGYSGFKLYKGFQASYGLTYRF